MMHTDVLNIKDMEAAIRQPKKVASIKICGVINIEIFDSTEFVRPIKEQIKNLHDMLCIDVELFE